jgi:putative molybdopterin biosynthesis protein
MAAPGPNRVRAAREALSLSQAALAGAARLSRQSISAIEAGRAMPAVDVALRIATALQQSVESLFCVPAAPAPLVTQPVAPARGSAAGGVAQPAQHTGRVALAHIAGRWLSYPLSGEAAYTSADALVLAHAEGGRRRARSAVAATLSVEPVRPLEDVQSNLVLMGCALGLGLLADRLNSRLAALSGVGRCLWVTRSSTESLAALASEQTHIAGVHLMDARTGQPSLAEVRRLAGSQALSVITLARWEAGLLAAPGNPKQLRSAACAWWCVRWAPARAGCWSASYRVPGCRVSWPVPRH